MKIKTKKSLGSSRLQTEEMIREVKSVFKFKLSKALSLHEVSAPLFVKAATGINDDLNGVEKPVSFNAASVDAGSFEIVQSLAKWKRLKLSEWKIQLHEGIITEMKALRPSEKISPIHSIFVDQWDWEKHISAKDRNLYFLKATVEKIYKTIVETQKYICRRYSQLTLFLPKKITFIHSEELLALYPSLSPKEREMKIAEEFGAVFIIGIGHCLQDGKEHDLRAPDYDDWSTKTEKGFRGLNGDIILWNPVLKSSFEVSSMGIRVDKKALLYQLKYTKTEDRRELFFHSKLINEELIHSIGGGIGQSRLAMFMLQKEHIGQVQTSSWPKEVEEIYAAELL